MKSNYYGNENNNRISYLEFGSIDTQKQKKDVWGFWLDQDAYDLYMFSRYARDLFAVRNYIQSEEKSVVAIEDCFRNTAHDKISDYIAKYVGMMTISSNSKNNKERAIFAEVGSSLMAIIEEFLAIDETVNHGKCIDFIKSMRYIGSDISELMNQGAHEFHPEYLVDTYTEDTVSKFLNAINEEVDLLYGLSVSLRYALRESEDLIKIANQCKLAVFNRISFSKTDTLVSDMGTGKSVYIISLPEYTEKLAQMGISAKFHVESIQKDRDGAETIRATVIMAKEENLLVEYQKNHNCMMEILQGKVDTWEGIEELLTY